RDQSLKADVYIAYFNTDDYASRIISKERNILYTYYSPFLYGEGLRATLVFNCNYRKRLYLSLKGALTHYYDRDVIGSDTEAIEGSNKTDLNMQVRWKF
ncbi:MAG: helix-hairpin-helix domain-containing protein, partial [Tannerella sp.]|nr:helix-hairpin-helix domain-containing protein [Tannerella sp.]